MEIILRCNPPKSTAQASNRILKGKNGKYFVGKMQSSKAKQTESDLISLLCPYVPEIPLEDALRVEIKWVYPWRSAEPKKNKAKGFKFCDTRPDADNICKLLFDTMTRLGFWIDDSQIAELHFQKLWADEPRIEINITQIDED